MTCFGLVFFNNMDLYLIFLNSTQLHSSPTTTLSALSALFASALFASALSAFILELDSIIIVFVEAETSAQLSELSEVIIKSGLLGFDLFGSP